MRILVTGTAGFIGNALALNLLERGDEVVGIDNLNAYYDVQLKRDRLARLADYRGFTDLRQDLEDRETIASTFRKYAPQRVVNLAAQAGVRYSLTNPHAYISSNIQGFMNILELCRHHGVENLVYASSSSVYGANTRMPFSVHHNVDHPVSLYAATKKANELMAHTYSHLYGFPTTGLRFFTVYGPAGRPDMVMFRFVQWIAEDCILHALPLGSILRNQSAVSNNLSYFIQNKRIQTRIISSLYCPSFFNVKGKCNDFAQNFMFKNRDNSKYNLIPIRNCLWLVYVR